MNRFRNTLTQLFVGLLTAGTFSACDSATDVEVSGSFAVNVTGDGINRQFNGNVVLAEEEDEDGQPVALIYLTDREKLAEIEAGEGVLGGFARAGMLDDINVQLYGVEDIVAYDGVGSDFVFILVTDEEEHYYVSRGGSVNVTQASGNVIKGTFTMSGLEIEVATEEVQEVTITGSFQSAQNVLLDRPLFYGPTPIFGVLPVLGSAPAPNASSRP